MTVCKLAFAFTMHLSLALATPVLAECVSLPLNVLPAPVEACESDTHYTFKIVGKDQTYEKQKFRQDLLAALERWFIAAGTTMPTSGEVEFWLAVPDTSPASTQARAVFYWEGGAIVAYLAIDPAKWKLANRHIGVLPEDTKYPQSFGYQPGTLVIQAAPDTSPTDLNNFVANYGAEQPQSLGANWQIYKVPALKEQVTMEAIASDPAAKLVVNQVTTNSMLEWISLRQRIFAFSVPSP